MQPTELVDLILIFSSDLDLVCGFVLLGELQESVSNCKAASGWDMQLYHAALHY